MFYILYVSYIAWYMKSHNVSYTVWTRGSVIYCYIPNLSKVRSPNYAIWHNSMGQSSWYFCMEVQGSQKYKVEDDRLWWSTLPVTPLPRFLKVLIQTHSPGLGSHHLNWVQVKRRLFRSSSSWLEDLWIQETRHPKCKDGARRGENKTLPKQKKQNRRHKEVTAHLYPLWNTSGHTILD